jgi:hypothetical protein
MSLKAGGGNLGTTFSTLTYSDMIAMVGCRAWGCEGCCGGSIVDEKTAQTCFRPGLRNRANGPLRNRTGCSLTKQPTTCILLPCICRILNLLEPWSIRAMFLLVILRIPSPFCSDTAHVVGLSSLSPFTVYHGNVPAHMSTSGRLIAMYTACSSVFANALPDAGHFNTVPHGFSV